MRSLLKIMLVARDLWPYYIAVILCSLAMAVTSLFTPFIVKSATDYLVDVTQGLKSGIGPAIWLAVALLIAELCNTLFTNIGGYLGDVMAIRLRSTLSRNYFEKLLTLPQRYFDNELTGTIINRLSRSITETTGFLNAFANNFFSMLITVGAVVVITLYYSWPLALLILIIYPLFMWLTGITSSRWQKYEGEKNREFDIAGGRFAEVIGQIRVVKSFVQERRELEDFSGRYQRTIDITRRQSQYWHRMDVIRRAVLNIIFFGIYAIIFVQTTRGVFTIGVMVLLVQLVNMARNPVFSMSYLVDFAQRAIAGSKDYFKVMAELPEPGVDLEPQETSSHNVGQNWGVSFDDIAFGYTDGDSVLRDVSFDVPSGSRIALVSESGEGKTTLMSLLMRLYAPQSGGIRIAGRDITESDPKSVRQNIGVVFQDPSLFSGTIRENISYAKPDATDEEIIQAAQSANAHDFISAFPNGYDSEIGERGLKLSGGQKQRIAVARAMLKDAPILVLDEATSSLDSKSEQLVHEGLENLMENRTTIIIAHRLSTIASVDRIVTLRNGTVDEIGSPADLAQTGGIYAELLTLQAATGKKAKKKLRQYDIHG